MEEVLKAQCSIVGLPSTLELTSVKSRRFIMEGSLACIRDQKKTSKLYRVFLFNDMIIYTEIKSRYVPSSIYKYVSHKLLQNVVFIDYTTPRGGSYVFEIVHTDDKQKFKFQTGTATEKLAWKSNLESQIQVCTVEQTHSESDVASQFSITLTSPTEHSVTRVGMMRAFTIHSRKRSGTGLSNNVMDGNVNGTQTPSTILLTSANNSETTSITDSPIPSPPLSASSTPNTTDTSRLLLPQDGRLRSLSAEYTSDDNSGVSTSSPLCQYLHSPSPSPSDSPSNSSQFLLADEQSDSNETNDDSEESEQSQDQIDTTNCFEPSTALQRILHYDDTSTYQAFIFVYREFTTPTNLLKMLNDIYHGESEPLNNQQPQIVFSTYNTKKKVLEFIKNWILYRYEEDFKRKRLFGYLLDFFKKISLPIKADDEESENYQNEVNKIKLLILRIGKKRPLGSSGTATPLPLSPLLYNERLLNSLTHSSSILNLSSSFNEVKFLESSSRTLAEQWTLVDFTHFKRVKIIELSGLLWTKEDYKVCTVNSMAERFNTLSQWVCTEIVTTKDRDQRVRVIEKMLDLAHKLCEIRNLYGLMAVMGGINRAPVFRLKQTWSFVSSSALSMRKSLNDIVESKSNFKNLREILKKNGPPAIPYFGLYTRDMTFIEQGNETVINGLVNVPKIEMCAGIYREIQYYQSQPYQFEEDNSYTPLLRKMIPMPEELLYTHSLRIEPMETIESPRKNS